MNFIRRVDLGKRLRLGFGLNLLLLAVIVAVSLSRLGSQAAAIDTLTAHASPKIEAAQNVAFATLDIARIARNLILLTEKTAVEKNQALYAQDRATIDQNMALLDRLVDSDRGRTLLADLKRTGEVYFTFTEEVVALGQKNELKAATTLLFGPRFTAQGAYLKASRALLDAERSVVVDAGAAAPAAYRSAVITLLLVAGLTCAAGIACAIVITRSITVPMREAVKIARSVAEGDLTSEIQVDSTDEAGQLLAALKAMNDKLAGIVGSVRQSSDSIATGSGQIATGNADLSQRTEQQAANLQQTAASMAQMHGAVIQNAEAARTATQLAASASAVALQGGEVVGRVVSTMDHISASSKKIADIVGVIDGIAFQTNILALNAAVEAARAGEQGRGFAVVASEVRSLAQRSADSARQIKSLIAESVETVEAGSRLVGGAGSTMTDIVGQVRRVADLIGEMSASTEEQSKGIGQVTDAVGQLDRVTQQNAALVEESAAAADSLKQQAVRMTELVSVFKLAPAVGGHETAGAPRLVARPAAAPGLVARPAAAPRPRLVSRPAAAVARAAVGRKPTPAEFTVQPRKARPATPAATAPARARAPEAVVTPGSAQDWESF